MTVKPDTISADLRWPGGEMSLRFLIGPMFGLASEYQIDVILAAGRFRGEATSEVIDLPEFLRALERLYETLDGEARLRGYYDDGLNVVLTAKKRGRIDLGATLGSGMYGDSDQVLSVRAQIDQSFLPPFVTKVRQAAARGSKAL